MLMTSIYQSPETAYRLNMLAPKSDNLNLITEIHVAEGENWLLLQVDLSSPHCHTYTCIYSYTRIIKCN